MLEQFHKIWYGHLGQTNLAPYKLKLSSLGARMVHAVPYRAGLKAREGEKEEIDKMLTMKVIKPAQTGQALPIVYIPG